MVDVDAAAHRERAPHQLPGDDRDDRAQPVGNAVRDGHVTVGPGEISTALALMGVAKSAGTKILFLTAEPESRGAALASHVLVIPAQTMANDRGAKATSILPMGSLYEGALFVLFEAMVLKLRDRLGVTPDLMRGNHTNME